MLDKNSDVSRLLDRLYVKKLIDKKTSTNDKRAADINLTEEGVELLKTIDKKQQSLDSFLVLKDEDAVLLSDLLDKGRG